MSQLSLYEGLLGASYNRLPLGLQKFHRLTGRTVLQGWVETEAPSSPLARAFAYCLGTPRSTTSGPLRFEIDAEPRKETWTRHFPARTMTSQMHLVGNQVEERLGAARLTFRLAVADDALKMELTKMTFFGVPCPKWAMPRVVAVETASDDRLRFRVAAALPLIGVVADYRGHLDLESKVTS